MRSQESFNISYLLLQKGNKRLEIDNDITKYILNDLPNTLRAGINVEFLISKKYESEGGKWNEYNLLVSVCKITTTTEYNSYAFEGLSDLFKQLKICNFDSATITEVDCSLANKAYILINLIENNGKENK